MRVLAQIVARNEADRYWQSWLDWHLPIFDRNVHVYDDDSTDDTASMAADAGAFVTARNGDGPSFLEHEGHMRQHAWDAFERAMQPEPGDWVFAIDADEFLVARRDEQDALYRACQWAGTQRRGAYMVTIPEVFRTQLRDTGELVDPCVRVDGWWGKIAGTRLFAWRSGGKFSNRPMGSGSEPGYVVEAPRSTLNDLWLMHYGYARPEDQQAKFERYSVLTGHANAHVASIVTEPTLVRWDGPTIDVILGRHQSGPGKVTTIPLTPIADSEVTDDLE